jgi:hypothetical protein
MVLRRKTGSVKNSVMLPSSRAAPPSAASCAFFQVSGSCTLRRISTMRSAGSAPMANTHRQLMALMTSVTNAAKMLPTAESAWRVPSAIARERLGQTSATSAAPAANSPPTPSAIRNRQM